MLMVHQCYKQMDRQTDGRTTSIAIPCYHYVHRAVKTGLHARIGVLQLRFRAFNDWVGSIDPVSAHEGVYATSGIAQKVMNEL